MAFKGQRAVVVGATKGIGRGIAMHLAREGATVLAASRSRERGEALVREMRAASPVGTATEREGGWPHAYVPLDAFSLASCAEFVEEVTARAERAGGHGGVDMLVLTQGMATLQGYTPTAEGLDEKLTLHVYSRAALAIGLAPALERAPMPRVLTVLSAGVHGSYSKWDSDVDLSKGAYSIKNAADAAGVYNDVLVEQMSVAHPKVAYTHASPGFVNTNWGEEMPLPVKFLVRCLQPFGRSPAKCADKLVGGMVAAQGDKTGGWYLIDQDGVASPKPAKVHEAAKGPVWEHIIRVVRDKGAQSK